MKSNKIQSITIVVLFCTMIVATFAFHIPDTLRAGKSFLRETVSAEGRIDFSNFEEPYNKSYTDDFGWVDTYGLVNRMLGKREVANFEVIKDYSESLYVPEDENDREDPDKAVDSIVALCEETRAIGSQFLFVQPAYKEYSGEPELDGYATSFLDGDYDSIARSLGESEVPVLDLRKEEDCRKWYRTDHHWTCDAAFAATRHIVDRIEKDGQMELSDDDAALADASSYERIEYPDSFLGSAGVKVGMLYAGKDDFSYLSPLFATDLGFRHYIMGECDKSYSGTFDEAFIDESLLGNAAYSNKYNAFLHGGYVESVVENRLAPNDLKVLLVGHSYGRPVTQYLSLYFAETRYLDPQEGRYNGDYAAYVEGYRPDVVVVMYDGPFNVG